MKAREEFKPFDVTEYLGTAEDRAAYLRAMWEDSSGDPAIVATALGDVARALGMSQIARDTGVAREALYKALSPRGNPELGTIVKVLRALGLELSVQAADRAAEHASDRPTDAIFGRGASAPRSARAHAEVSGGAYASSNRSAKISREVMAGKLTTRASAKTESSSKRTASDRARVASKSSTRGGRKR